MRQNNDTYTFFSILAFVAAILVFAGIVGGSFELENIGWLVLVLLAIGIGLMGAAMALGRGSSSTAVVPSSSASSTSDLTVPGTEVSSMSAQSAVATPAAETPAEPDEEVETTDDDSANEVTSVQVGALTDAPPTTPQEQEAVEEVIEVEADPDPEDEVVVSSEPDDLTRLEGIGPKMSAALIEHGVTTFQKLSEQSLDQIQVMLEDAGLRFAPSAESWAEQASYAAKGDWDGLDELQDRLVAGRYPTDE